MMRKWAMFAIGLLVLVLVLVLVLATHDWKGSFGDDPPLAFGRSLDAPPRIVA